VRARAAGAPQFNNQLALDPRVVIGATTHGQHLDNNPAGTIDPDICRSRQLRGVSQEG
jgi:hypothetical protein